VARDRRARPAARIIARAFSQSRAGGAARLCTAFPGTIAAGPHRLGGDPAKCARIRRARTRAGTCANPL